MTDYTKRVKALRHCATRSNGCVTCAGCPMSSENGDVIECINALHKDAADAIEALQAQLQKRGKWIVREVDIPGEIHPVAFRCMCSMCRSEYVFPRIPQYCPDCGSMNTEKTEVQDADK